MGKVVQSQEKNRNQNYGKMPLNPPDQQTSTRGHARAAEDVSSQALALQGELRTDGSSKVFDVFTWRLGNPIPSYVWELNITSWKCIQRSSWQSLSTKQKSRNSLEPHDEGTDALWYIHRKDCLEGYYKTIVIYFSVLEAENPWSRCWQVHWGLAFPLTVSLMMHLHGKEVSKTSFIKYHSCYCLSSLENPS